MKIAKKILLVFVLSIVLIPVAGIVQLFSGLTLYDDYMRFISPIYSYLRDNFSWILVGVLSLLAIGRKVEVKYLIQEKLRKRQYYFEYERWRNTPYIPPLLFYYMMAPPTSFSPYTKEQAENDFYPLLVRDFRDRVTMNAAFSSAEPTKRVSALRVVGFKIIGVWLLHFTVLGLILYYVTPSIDMLVNTNAKFLIPVILHIVGYNLMVAIAIGQTAPWKFVDNKLRVYFQEDYFHHEPYIPWVDVLPDTDRGYGIEKMWERDCMRRIQLSYDLAGWNFPNNEEDIKWINLSIPSNPYPGNLDLSWAPDAREHVKSVKEKWLNEHEAIKEEAIKYYNNEEVGQIVSFHKRKKA